MLTGTFDFQTTAFTANATCIGELLVDGVIQPEQALFAMTSNNLRATVSQTWRIPLTVGAHTLKTTVKRDVANNTMQANTPHTTLTAIVFNQGS